MVATKHNGAIVQRCQPQHELFVPRLKGGKRRGGKKKKKKKKKMKKGGGRRQSRQQQLQQQQQQQRQQQAGTGSVAGAGEGGQESCCVLRRCRCAATVQYPCWHQGKCRALLREAKDPVCNRCQEFEPEHEGASGSSASVALEHCCWDRMLAAEVHKTAMRRIERYGRICDHIEAQEVNKEQQRLQKEHEEVTAEDEARDNEVRWSLIEAKANPRPAKHARMHGQQAKPVPKATLKALPKAAMRNSSGSRSREGENQEAMERRIIAEATTRCHGAGAAGWSFPRKFCRSSRQVA